MSSVTLNMGAPVLAPADMGIETAGESFISREIELFGQRGAVTCVGFQKPHCILYVADAGRYDIQLVGDALVALDIFPRDIVCDFVQIRSDSEVALSTWEKGRENLQSAESAAAAAVAAVLDGYCTGEISAHLPRGEVKVCWDREKGKVTVTGDSPLLFAL